MFDFIVELVLFLPSMIKRRMDLGKAWTGMVRKKEARPYPILSRFTYYVTFLTDSGKKKRLRMKKRDFDRYMEGGRYAKKSGEPLPGPQLD